MCNVEREKRTHKTTENLIVGVGEVEVLWLRACSRISFLSLKHLSYTLAACVKYMYRESVFGVLAVFTR